MARAREIVLRCGWNSTSFQIVNPGIERWFSSEGDAVVGYVTAARIRVVVGAPVCESGQLERVVEEFERDATDAGQTVCYFCAEERLETVVERLGSHSKFLLGAQPVWSPVEWSEIVSSQKSIRAQLNRARNKGVVVSEWPVERAGGDERLRETLQLWLASKGLPPLHFMVEPEILNRLDHRRVFVAECRDTVVGFLTLSPVALRNGWLFEQFPHRPGAPNGTVESMVDAAMIQLASDGCEYATLGLSPLSRRSGVEPGEQPIWLRIVLEWMRRHGSRFYNFDGLDAFKAKLRPQHWEPVFAVSNEARLSFKTLYSIASAFSGNAPVKLVTQAIAKAASTELRWIKNRVW